MDHATRPTLPPHRRPASSMCWCRLRSTGPILPGASRHGVEAGRRGLRAARPARSGRGGVAERKPDPRLHNRLKDVGEKLDVPPLKQELRSPSTGSPTTRSRPAAWCCECACGWAGDRTRADARRRAADRRAAGRMTPARRRLIEILADGLLHGKSEAAREAGGQLGVIDGLVDEGTLTVETMPPPRAAAARSAICAARVLAPAAHGRRCLAGVGGERRLSHSIARRRHRFGQDRSLF